MQSALTAGGSYDLPHLSYLLSLSEFDPLRRFLAERETDVPALQRSIDDLVAQVRATLTTTSLPPTP